jgi:hypothetical protein
MSSVWSQVSPGIDGFYFSRDERYFGLALDWYFRQVRSFLPAHYN